MTLGDDEVAEVIASHLLEAYRLDPDAPRQQNRCVPTPTPPCSERASAPPPSARRRGARYFGQGAELAGEPGAEAAALMRAGEMSTLTGDPAGAEEVFARAVSLYQAAEMRTRPVARRHGSPMRNSCAVTCKAL